MNAGSAPIPLIPDNAPFSEEQRAWLNGFLAGLYGNPDASAPSALTPAEPEEDFSLARSGAGDWTNGCDWPGTSRSSAG